MYTVEKEQSKGIYSSMLQYLTDYYCDNSRLFVYAKVDYFNILSAQIKNKIGFKTVGESFSLKFFEFNFCYYKYWNTKFRNNYLFYTSEYVKDLKWV